MKKIFLIIILIFFSFSCITVNKINDSYNIVPTDIHNEDNSIQDYKYDYKYDFRIIPKSKVKPKLPNPHNKFKKKKENKKEKEDEETI